MATQRLILTIGEVFWSNKYIQRFGSFSESPYHNTFYAKATGIGNKGILQTTGSLKLDYYRMSESESGIWKGIGKRVIWAPHHSINDECLRMSNFKWNCKFF